MVHELGGRRSGYQSPEVVLAEARRLADRIRRDAERDAASIRREAASWASQTRAEAEDLRDAVLERLSEQRSLPPAAAVHREPPQRFPVAYEDIPPPPPPPPPPPRSSTGQAAPSDDGVLTGEVIDLRAEAAVRRGRVIGDVVEVNLESKLHDVVVLALQRMFEEPESDRITAR